MKKYKTCTKCVIKKTIINFRLLNNDNKKATSFVAWCDECRKAYWKEWYALPKNKKKRLSDRATRYLTIQNYEKAEMRKKYKTEEYREKNKKNSSKYRNNYPERIKARNILYYAIKTGKIIKGPCGYKSGKCEGGVQAFIEDYSEPLKAKWFCQKHHALCTKISSYSIDKGRKSNLKNNDT